MALKKSDIKKINLKNLETPFQKDMNFDILGTICSIFVAVIGFYIQIPTTAGSWVIRIIDTTGIILGGYAIGLTLDKNAAKQRIKKEKRALENYAKAKHMSLGKYLSKKIEEISKPIRKWADLNHINYDYLEYSNFRHTIDFHNFPIDYIDFQIVEYHLIFLVRLHDESYIKRILDFLSSSKIKIVLTLDNNHLSPKKKFKINEEGIETLKMTLIDSILGPTHALTIF